MTALAGLVSDCGEIKNSYLRKHDELIQTGWTMPELRGIITSRENLHEQGVDLLCKYLVIMFHGCQYITCLPDFFLTDEQ